MSGAEIDGLDIQAVARPADDARQRARAGCAGVGRLLPQPGVSTRGADFGRRPAVTPRSYWAQIPELFDPSQSPRFQDN